jgi:hypothetical protein
MFLNAQYDKTYAQYRLLSGIGQLVHTLGLQWPEESKVEVDEQKAQEQEKEEAPQEDKSAATGDKTQDKRLTSLMGK